MCTIKPGAQVHRSVDFIDMRNLCCEHREHVTGFLCVCWDKKSRAGCRSSGIEEHSLLSEKTNRSMEFPRPALILCGAVVAHFVYGCSSFSDWLEHNRITPHNVGGFVCYEWEAGCVCVYAVMKKGLCFIAHTPAAVKALDKSFILQIPAKTKARKSCHLKVLTVYER